ncbi:hypothetical protein [Sandarakinorhabdus sp.]|uniref:hypothetical protein n=1 Tax=Sandarakinorhabdus sp. TaxID=1916663 RepID=UPI00286E7ABF|nr:hypothetical protein [Sandarakinorhabdus sp.]
MALVAPLISAIASRALARHLGGSTAGPLGAVAGLALPGIARRLGPWGMIGVAAGAWAMRRLADTARPSLPAALPSPAPRQLTITPPPIPMAMPGDY